MPAESEREETSPHGEGAGARRLPERRRTGGETSAKRYAGKQSDWTNGDQDQEGDQEELGEALQFPFQLDQRDDEDVDLSRKIGVIAQPAEENGVTNNMATLAINPEFYRNPAASENQRNSRAVEGAFEGMDDAQIMLRLSAGDMAAFDVLLEKYRKPIIHFMYRMVHNEAVAEELAQEVFLRVYRSRETYRAEARFSTWLYRIATNLGVNHARDTRHERAAATIYLDETDSETGMTPEVADQTPGAEARMLQAERLAAIKQHVLALPERQRMAVLMHKYDGMDYKQIAQVLKLSESATKSLLFRAYQTLREKLSGFL